MNGTSAGFGAILLFAGAQIIQAQTSSSVSTSTNDQFVVTSSLQQPAVSQINGKLDYAGGNMNSSMANNFGGSISLPVSHQFGAQADALYSRISDLNFYGGAGHFFWRDPSIGLLGLAGGYLHRDGADDINTFQIGAEGELYWHQFTFGFSGGIGSIDYRYSAPFIDTNPTRFVGRISADYYPLENLRIGASFTSAFEDYFGKIEAEYQLPLPGLALTAEGAWGNHGYDHWLVGVRFYFGSKKSLRDRQRQDDPPSLMPQILDSLGVYGAEFNHKMDVYLAEHPYLPGNSNGGDYGLIDSSGGGDYGFTLGSVTVSNPPQ
jgi:hypothetical protein